MRCRDPSQIHTNSVCHHTRSLAHIRLHTHPHATRPEQTQGASKSTHTRHRVTRITSTLHARTRSPPVAGARGPALQRRSTRSTPAQLQARQHPKSGGRRYSYTLLSQCVTKDTNLSAISVGRRRPTLFGYTLLSQCWPVPPGSSGTEALQEELGAFHADHRALVASQALYLRSIETRDRSTGLVEAQRHISRRHCPPRTHARTHARTHTHIHTHTHTSFI